MLNSGIFKTISFTCTYLILPKFSVKYS